MTPVRILLLALLLLLPAASPAAEPASRAACLDVLRQGLARHATDFWPAMHAAEALTRAGQGAETRAALAPLLATETDAQKRCGLARELVRAGDDRPLPILLDILRHPDPHGHVHAAESLFKLGWCADPDLLRQALASRNPRLSLMAAAALARGGHPEGLVHLRRGLAQETDPDLIYLFAWALGQTGAAEPDAAALHARLPDLPDAWRRSFLEHALARLGDLEGRAALLRNLASPDARITAHAADTAAALQEEATRAPLTALLTHPDLDTRLRAAQALLALP